MTEAEKREEQMKFQAKPDETSPLKLNRKQRRQVSAVKRRANRKARKEI